ncbi:kelch-like protein 1 [Gopherus flavomarginatus]|uniref:kelch-like protein 1 n=1 Tax=Gopherus flavomarginatus TaxID=286002 RepID=UPI0021CBE2CA|nr:kelch-like protein 1 [Gopherus flavomarginatus]
MDSLMDVDNEKDDTQDAPQSLGSFLSQGLKQMYLDKQFCDATLVVEGRRFPCHRMLLASVSPYFRVMFTSSFKESQDGEVLLKAIAPSIIQSMLNYLYLEEISLTAETAEELFIASCRLQILPLEEIISRFFVKNISMENCLGIYALAYAHNHKDLLHAAMHHIGFNFGSISEDYDFMCLDLSTLTSIISSDDLVVASELVVYQAVRRWVTFKPAKRLPVLSMLMRHVRLPFLTREALAEIQADSELYGDVPMWWKQLVGEERLWESGGLRQGIYDECIVCMELHRYRIQHVENDYSEFDIDSDLLSGMDCFDPYTGRWKKLPGLKCLRHPASTAVEHKLYLSGGKHQDGSCSDTLYEYNSFTGQWIQLPSMSMPRDSHGFLACNLKLYALAGRNDRHGLTSAESFDLVQKAWTPISNLPFRLIYFASTVLKNKLYLIGGEALAVVPKLVYSGILIYDITLDMWTQMPLDFKCYETSAISMNNGICVIGGFCEEKGRQLTPRGTTEVSFLSSRKCFFLNEDGKVCQEVVIPELPETFAFAGVVCWQRRIYLMGGINCYQLCNRIFYWEPGDSSWTECQEHVPSIEGFIRIFKCVTLKIPKNILYPFSKKYL